MIVPVLAQVVSQSINPLGEEGNLNLWRTSVCLMNTKTGDYFVFLCPLQRHASEAPLCITRSNRPI